MTGFREGDHVIYTPDHAGGDVTHPDAERGIVSGTRRTDFRRIVFVKFNHAIAAHGWDGATAKGCDASNLHRE